MAGRRRSKRTEKKTRRLYGEEALQAALDGSSVNPARCDNEIDVQATATEYNIPKSTMYRLLSNKTTSPPKLGRKTLLSDDEEALLVSWVHKASDSMNPWGFEEATTAARLIYQCRGSAEIKFPEFSKGWFTSFCRRWDLSEKKAIHVSKARSDALDSMGMMSYLVSVKHFVDTHRLRADQVWTADETTSIPKKPSEAKKLGAVGKQLFVSSGGIKVPKFTTMCCVSASGEQIPPWFLIPSSSAKRVADDIPVIGPAGYMDDSSAEYSSKGSMTSQKFRKWLTDIFVPRSRENLSDDEWVLLCLDNCSSHVGLETLQLAQKHKIALATFFPNSTHVGSPLDVGLYGPMKSKLKKSLEKRKELSYKTMASWIGPVIDSVFTKKNILKAFHTTGIWDLDLNGPNINAVNPQYCNLMTDLPERVKRSNLEKRTSLVLRIQEEALENYHKEQLNEIRKGGKCATGPSFVSKIVAGTVVTPLSLSQVLEKQQELVELKNQEQLKKKTSMEIQKTKHNTKIESIKETHKVALKKSRDTSKNLKREMKSLERRLKTSENRLEKEKSAKNDVDVLLTTICEILPSFGVGADPFIEQLRRNNVSPQNLKRIRTTMNKHSMPKPKRVRR